MPPHTLMLAVVRKMVLTKAIEWTDESDAANPLHTLLEYAALAANGEPSGRLIHECMAGCAYGLSFE